MWNFRGNITLYSITKKGFYNVFCFEFCISDISKNCKIVFFLRHHPFIMSSKKLSRKLRLISCPRRHEYNLDRLVPCHNICSTITLLHLVRAWKSHTKIFEVILVLFRKTVLFGQTLFWNIRHVIQFSRLIENFVNDVL